MRLYGVYLLTDRRGDGYKYTACSTQDLVAGTVPYISGTYVSRISKRRTKLSYVLSLCSLYSATELRGTSDAFVGRAYPVPATCIPFVKFDASRRGKKGLKSSRENNARHEP